MRPRNIVSRIALSVSVAALSIGVLGGRAGAAEDAGTPLDAFGIQEIYADAPPPSNHWTFAGNVDDSRFMEQRIIAEVRKAYNAHTLKLTGANQKIAILIDTVPKDTDVQHFWKLNSLAIPLTNVEKINVKGGHLPPPNDADHVEEAS